VRSVRNGEGDYREKNLWKSEVLSLEWNRDGVMHRESGDDDELARER